MEIAYVQDIVALGLGVLLGKIRRMRPVKKVVQVKPLEVFGTPEQWREYQEMLRSTPSEAPEEVALHKHHYDIFNRGIVISRHTGHSPKVNL